MDYLLDTNFLIGLWRRPADGPEAGFLEEHADGVLALPWIVKGEFLAGAMVATHKADVVQGFLSRYPVTLPTDTTLTVYARLYAMLHRARKAVSVNDLWIAASATEHGLPLLTRNVREFSRIEGLQVVDYAREAN
ncbi:MAG TPA: type II toxin-antitoxin system VapC family toxin [Gammaproteobacteria bacterium]|nr:type II toxin-antitoxin system VapC family toxin [Gammaproteobacteria bacterium]